MTLLSHFIYVLYDSYYMRIVFTRTQAEFPKGKTKCKQNSSHRRKLVSGGVLVNDVREKFSAGVKSLIASPCQKGAKGASHLAARKVERKLLFATLSVAPGVRRPNLFPCIFTFDFFH